MLSVFDWLQNALLLRATSQAAVQSVKDGLALLKLQQQQQQQQQDQHTPIATRYAIEDSKINTPTHLMICIIPPTSVLLVRSCLHWKE